MKEQKTIKLFHGITNISDDIIQEAQEAQPASRVPNPWLRWGVAAACVCLIAVGAFSGLNYLGGSDPGDGAEEAAPTSDSAGVIPRDAEDIGGGMLPTPPYSSSRESIAVMPYAETRDFSRWKAQLEEEKMIPVMGEDYTYTCAAHYNEDNTLYSLKNNWHRNEPYSDLTITAAPQPVEETSDCIVVEVDENGNPIETEPTVTERDGITITTEGREDRDKTVTFRKDGVWYQIAGSWGDVFSEVQALVDWVWEHPTDLSRFPLEEGDRYTIVTLAEYPEAFSGWLPDFTGFGLQEVETTVLLKNGVPVRFEGHYSKGPEMLDSIHWCFETAPERDDLRRSSGELKDLKKSSVLNSLKQDRRITFTWDGNCVTVFSQESDAIAWDLIHSLQ